MPNTFESVCREIIYQIEQDPNGPYKVFGLRAKMAWIRHYPRSSRRPSAPGFFDGDMSIRFAGPDHLDAHQILERAGVHTENTYEANNKLIDPHWNFFARVFPDEVFVANVHARISLVEWPGLKTWYRLAKKEAEVAAARYEKESLVSMLEGKPFYPMDGEVRGFQHFNYEHSAALEKDLDLNERLGKKNNWFRYTGQDWQR